MNPPLDIRPDHLWQVKSVLREHLPPGVKVFAFGSRAKWTTRNSSDLDICLKGANALPDKALSRIDIDLEESVIPYKVDVIDWNRITPGFQANIKDDLAEINIMEWDTVPLSLVCENMDGLRAPITKADRKSGQYPYYGATEIIDYVDNYIYEGTYLLVAEDGENLRSRKLPIAFLAKGKFWVNNHAHVLRSNRYSNIEFLLYAVSQADIESHLTGTTMPKLTQANLNRIPVFMPPPDEQLLISRILQSLDEKIELNRRMNETLEAMAHAVFKDWFVDFGPVRAKIEGREPYLPPELWALFPDALDDEGKPEGWEILTLNDLSVKITSGSTPTTAQVANADDKASINFLKARSISDFGNVVFDKVEKIQESIHLGNLKRSILHEGDVLYTIAGTIGRMLYVENSILPANINQAIAIIRPDCQRIPGRYIALLMGCQGFQDELHSGIVQAVQANLNLTKIGNAKAVVPDRDTAFRLFNAIDALLDFSSRNFDESQLLSKTRDTLLPKLMSGEIRLAGAEKTAENAA